MRKNRAIFIGLVVLCMVIGCGESKAPSIKVTGVAIEIGGEPVSNKIIPVSFLGSIDLIAVVYPPNATNQAVKWESSDKTIVEVSDDGRVVGVSDSVDFVTITVTTIDGGYQDTCQVRVTVVSSVSIARVDSIAIPGGNLVMDINESVDLRAQISPFTAADHTVEWESSDPTVATINSSVVDGRSFAQITSLRAGTTTITATTNGKMANGERATGQCEVIIIDKPVREIVMRSRTWIFDKNKAPAATTTLVWEVLPATAANKNVTWSSSDPTVATVANGVVTGQGKEGTAIITATAADGSYVTGEVEVTVYDPAKYVYSWTATGSSNYTFASNGTNHNINGIDWTRVAVDVSGTENPSISADGLYIPKGTRLMIGATDTTPTTETSVINGQLDLLSDPIKLIIDYHSLTGNGPPSDTGDVDAVFQVFINNNTADEANSPLGISEGPCMQIIGNLIFDPIGRFWTFYQTEVIKVPENGYLDENNFFHPESLEDAFIGLRTNDDTTIVIHGIRIEKE